MSNKIGAKFGFLRKLKDFLIGATVYSVVRDLEERRLLVEYGLMLVVLGDMLGFPLPNYYRLRLLPYWLPRFNEWKTFLLRERDVTEKL
ncbi:MAG: hypothetical protein QW660_05100 [Candidatus Bathyarchaeia archaeon]|nr:hypothetical protein [Candidatus Bathyarchaeota archaeon]